MRRSRKLLAILALSALLLVFGTFLLKPEIFKSISFGLRGLPDVIVITVDTLRADRLGTYGLRQANTPTIDSIAENGMVFDRAYVPIPRTTPAIATMLTGLSPYRHGSREVRTPIHENIPTLAEILGARGFHSIAAVAQSVIGKKQGLDKGFDRFDEIPKSDHGPVVNERILALLETAPEDPPLFAWVHYVDPHWPYSPVGSASDSDSKRHCDTPFKKLKLPIGLLQANFDGIAEQIRTSCEALYQKEISVVDEAISELLSHLERHRPNRERLLIITADHGENIGEDGLYYEHGPSLALASSKVPLIFSGPYIQSNRSSDLFSMADLLPTVLGYLGEHPPNSDLDGFDLSCTLLESNMERCSNKRQFVYLESASNLNVYNTTTVYSGRRGGRHCFNEGEFSLCRMGPGAEPTLFNNQKDPGFRKALNSQHPKLLNRLLKSQSAWDPEEVRSRSVVSADVQILEIPRVEGGYSELVFPLDVESGEPLRDGSMPSDERASKIRQELQDFVSQRLRSKGHPIRDREAVDQLRSLGYVD